MKHQNQFQKLRKLRKPHKISLMGKVFDIYPLSYGDLQAQWSEGPQDPIHGYFDEMSSSIYINSNLKQSIYERVLLHELTHAILSTSGISNLLSSKLEEGICDAMESFVDLV